MCKFEMYMFIQLKFSVYGRKQTVTYTRVLQCSPASVGLAQAHRNKFVYGHLYCPPVLFLVCV